MELTWKPLPDGPVNETDYERYLAAWVCGAKRIHAWAMDGKEAWPPEGGAGDFLVDEWRRGARAALSVLFPGEEEE